MDLAEFALALSAVNVTLVALSAGLLWRQIKKQHDWNRKKAAHDLVFQALNELRSLRERLGAKIDIYDDQQTYATVKGDLTMQDHLILDAILNYLESMCIAVHNAVVDEDLMCNVFVGVLLGVRRWADPYIKQERSKSPFLWIGFEPYVETWQKKLQTRIVNAAGTKMRPL